MSLQWSSLFGMRLLHATIAVPAAALLTGCFSLQPVDRVTPSVGAEVAVDLTDAGRSALAAALGSDVAQVHGHLIRREGDDVVLAVTSTEFVRGGERTWAGETVHVHTNYASRYYENRVSTKRSLVVGGLIVGGLALLAAEALQPTATPDPGGSVVEPPGEKLRARPRGAIRFSTSILDARRRAQFLLPLLTRR